MIGFVQGKVDAISEDNVVIDTGGIGYNVRISAKTAQELPGIGQEVRLYTIQASGRTEYPCLDFCQGTVLTSLRRSSPLMGSDRRGDWPFCL